MRQRKRKNVLFIFTLVILFSIVSCGKAETAETPQENEIPTATVTSATARPTLSPTPQTLSAPGSYGPNLENFPAGFNPLTAQQVKDPSLLKTPAVMVSISHFPVNARPQAGLSFAPWVFEFYITEGTTRFLSVFYGAFPEPEIPITGDCAIRRDPIGHTPLLLGNRVWLDENQNGIQEDYEKGIGGVCINLYDSSGELVQQTSTDSNGYYGFSLGAGKYTVEFKPPAWLGFTKTNLGDEKKDSDVDQATGRAEAEVESSLLHLDAGLIPSEEVNPPASESTQLPTAEVGPVRSGRLLYIDIHDFFLNSCFIYASATPEILDLLPHCYLVPHDDIGSGAMLPLEKMKELAEENKNSTSGRFNYASNLFSDTPPAGGQKADRMDVYVAYLNQSAWLYDAPSQSWWRYVDDANFDTAGQLHPEVDRLTGRQLQFENVIVLYAEHEVLAPAILDMNLELGSGGYAYLFRDGLKYDIRWSTKARAYEKKTGMARPLYFVDAEGNPVPLKPGRTFIFVATPFSFVTEEGDGLWRVRYMPPEGAQ